VLAEKKSKGRARGSEALRDLGANPEGGAMIKVMKGRYGPYVTDGSTNATIPNDADPMTITLERAAALIADRVAKGGGKKPKKVKAKAKNGAKEKPAAKAKAPAKAKPAPAAKTKRKPVAAESE
jgi:DNA topoisomerase I